MSSYEGRLELTWTNKQLRLLAHEDGSCGFAISALMIFQTSIRGLRQVTWHLPVFYLVASMPRFCRRSTR